MRVTQIHVRDSKSLREYAYHEDKNGSCRQDMEDSKFSITKTTLLKMRSLADRQVFSPFWMAMEEPTFQNTVLKTYQL